MIRWNLSVVFFASLILLAAGCNNVKPDTNVADAGRQAESDRSGAAPSSGPAPDAPTDRPGNADAPFSPTLPESNGIESAGVGASERNEPENVGGGAASPLPLAPSLALPNNQTSGGTPSAAGPNSPAGNGQAEVPSQPQVAFKLKETSDPVQLIQHLQEIDVAIGDLVVAGANNILEKEAFVDNGIQLGKLKLATGERLANSPAATAEQRKSGVLAQVEALSHLSGIGDIESAQRLETLARSLVESNEPDLVHQSRVVLIGFELQSLQNGLRNAPEELLAQIEGLFQNAADRNFPEFMMLRQVHFVLAQMGFQEATERVKQFLATEYENVSDPQLRGEAWLFAAGDSQALANYNLASRELGTDRLDSQALFSAVRGLFEAFQTANTLEQLASAIANIEYSGNLELSRQIADFVEQEAERFPEAAAQPSIQQLLGDHRARVGLIGKPIELSSLIGFDGQPLDWSNYQGKVVLIDFWATWCLPCLQEMPNIRQVHQTLANRGFEVIGVNMDDSPEAARDLIERQAFPWRSFHFQDRPGFQSEFAQRNGLTMIPFIVIVGADGNVAHLHVRGEALDPTARTLLGLETSLIP